MTSLKLDQIVYFNAEHPKFKVEHLRTEKGKWTSPQDYQGDLVCEFSLQVPAKLSRIWLGNFWSARVEIHVGLSTWPVSQRELLVQKNFMNRLDVYQGAHAEELATFTEEEFEKVSDLYWDRVKITCSQPYRVQGGCFGLSLLNINGSPQFSSAVSQEPNAMVANRDLNSFIQEKCQVMFPQSSKDGSSPTRLINSSKTAARDGIHSEEKIELPKQRCEDFKLAARDFLKSLQFDNKDLTFINNLSFNDVRRVWQEKQKVNLSKEEAAMLKKMSQRYFSDLSEKMEKVTKSRKRKNMQDSIGSIKKQRTSPEFLSSSSSSRYESLSLPDIEPEKSKKNCRNALATIDIDLLSDDEKENAGSSNKSAKRRSKTTPPPEKVKLSGWISKSSQEPGSSQQLNTDKSESPPDIPWTATNIEGFDLNQLLGKPIEALKSKGILVQIYNYKSNKDLPLKDGKTLKTKKRVPVVFYKVGPCIYLVYEGRIYDPDVKEEHKERLFKEYSPQRVRDNRISPAAIDFLRTSEVSANFDLDPDISIVNDTPQNIRFKGTVGESYEECPLCNELFLLSVIQEHASDCTGVSEADQNEDDLPASPPGSMTPLEACPICGLSMDPAVLPEHAATCGSEPNSPVVSRPGTPSFGRCPVCDRFMPMSELEEHAAGCQGFHLNGGDGNHVNIMDSQRKCDFCEQLIPEYLMEEHVDECPARGIRRRVVSDIERRNSLKRTRK